MLRATIAFLIISMVIVVICSILLLIGLVHPSHRCYAFLARLWGHGVLTGAGAKLTIEGGEHIADGEPRFLVGNHQSALDIAVLFCVTRGHARFMAKKSLFRIPLFGWVLSQYGHAPIDRSSVRTTAASLKHMLDRLRERPATFAVFPEGTRSMDGKLLPFRQGAMRICQRAGMPIVPFAIHGSIDVHKRGANRVYPGPVKLVLTKPISADEAGRVSPKELSDRVFREVARCLIRAGGDPGKLSEQQATTEENKTDD